MSVTTMGAPAAAKRREIARPQPLPPAPVTITAGDAGTDRTDSLFRLAANVQRGDRLAKKVPV